MSFEELMKRGVERFSYIHESCQIDPTARIGAFNVIEPNVVIGPGTVIENFCEIMNGTVIGANCMIRSYSRIGPENIIGDEVTIKCSAITGPEVWIEDRAFIGPQTICFSDLKSKVAKTMIRAEAIVGGGCRIMAGIQIGKGAFIGAGSVVTKHVMPGVKVKGVPAK